MPKTSIDGTGAFLRETVQTFAPYIFISYADNTVGSVFLNSKLYTKVYAVEPKKTFKK